MAKPERRGRSSSTGAGPGALQKAGAGSAAAAAASPAAAHGSEARAAYQQYVKGKRQALDKLLKSHEKSPCAATCLVGAKLHVLEAVEAAFKVGAGHGCRAEGLPRPWSSSTGAQSIWGCFFQSKAVPGATAATVAALHAASTSLLPRRRTAILALARRRCCGRCTKHWSWRCAAR